MAKYSKKSANTEKLIEEAMGIARATQKPGQTKEQTKLIAQGIQKGIEQYKKQHAARKRELDKKIKKVVAAGSHEPSSVDPDDELMSDQPLSSKLPWVLLILSWLAFTAYYFIAR
ncbi:MAG: DUF2956 domain-containing protein [Gammaproteobacteria bacterium]|nr:DUF2956 domain-containing protein [Gammaproteobacteria bacterium]